METPQNRGYIAIIPAVVRYDKELKPSEKLLFGEISALMDAKGYCWASNKYFAELYDVAIETVSRWITHLVKKGYVKSKIVYAEDGKTVLQRKLWAILPVLDEDEDPIDEKIKGIDEKIKTPIDEKIKTPIDEKVKENVTSNELTRVNEKENIIKENSESETDSVPESDTPKKKRNNFVKPTIEEVRTYCKEINSIINPDCFYDHYESNGWKVGKVSMKDWKSTLRNWERRERKQTTINQKTCGDNKSQEFMDFEPF
jgi:hypothetical protein